VNSQFDFVALEKTRISVWEGGLAAGDVLHHRVMSLTAPYLIPLILCCNATLRAPCTLLEEIQNNVTFGRLIIANHLRKYVEVFLYSSHSTSTFVWGEEFTTVRSI
jgi:hypothetical protein